LTILSHLQITCRPKKGRDSKEEKKGKKKKKKKKRRTDRVTSAWALTFRSSRLRAGPVQQPAKRGTKERKEQKKKKGKEGMRGRKEAILHFEHLLLVGGP